MMILIHDENEDDDDDYDDNDGIVNILSRR